MKKWHVVTVVVVVVAALFLAACGATPEPQTIKETVVVEKEVVVTQEVEVEKEVEVTRVVKEEVEVEVEVTSTPVPLPQGGWVTEVNPHDVRCLNPILCGEGTPGDYFPKMFGRCVDVNAYTGEWEPSLCESWEISDDGLTYAFKVREGVNWTDGTPVTAKDFGYTYEGLMSGKLETWNVAAVQNIKEINLIDDMTIEFVMKAADCAAMGNLALRWIPAHVYAEDWSDLTTNPEYMEATVTNGPFKMKEWVHGDHVIWESNPDYWKGAPHVEGYIRRVVPSQNIGAQQLKTGEADIAPIVPENVAELEAQDHLVVYKYLRDAYGYLALQMGDPDNPQPRLNEDGSLNEDHGVHPILGDKRVRQAIAHAMDLDAMIYGINLGLAGPIAANGLPTIKWAYNDELQPREFSQEKAIELLEEAGWTDTDGDGVRECHACAYADEGAPLELNLLALAGYEISENRAILAQDLLNQIGFDIEVEMVESASMRDRRYAQNWDMMVQDWEDIGNDPHDEVLWASWADVPGGGGNNNVSYYNPDAEELFAEAKSVPGCDQAKRGEIYKKIQEIIYEDQPYIFLYQRKDVLAYNKRIGNFEPGPWYYEPDHQNWYIIEGE